MPKKLIKKPPVEAPATPTSGRSQPSTGQAAPTQKPKSVPLVPPPRRSSSVWDAFPLPGLTPTPRLSAASRDTAPAVTKAQPFKPGARTGTKASSKSAQAAGPKAGPPPTPEVRKNLTKRQVDAIREFALALADKMIDPDAVMICNPVSEPAALPLEELLYDRCRWCEVDIYYDRLMPSPLGLVRVCISCGVMLLEADKKGKN